MLVIMMVARMDDDVVVVVVVIAIAIAIAIAMAMPLLLSLWWCWCWLLLLLLFTTARVMYRPTDRPKTWTGVYLFDDHHRGREE